MKKWIRMVALLSAVGMVAVGCGSDAESPAPTTAAPTISAVDAGPLKVAIVAPSASDDLAFSQSMVDSVNALDRDIELSITDGTFIIEDAAAAIRGYAEDGHDVVIAHGTQYGASLVEIAPDFPDVTFAWGTASDTQGLDNVFAYAPAADEGGYINGWIASSLTETGVIGVVGPIEAGDAVAYINGFEAGALAGGAAEVNITYTGSFGDVALAAEAAEAHLSNNADVLTGTAQMVVGAVGVAADNGIPWFGTQANQTSLAPDLVVASQVYHWEVVLEEMLRLRDSGVVGGQAFEINLANGGLVIEFNDAFVLPAGVRAEAERLIEGIGTGAVDISASAATAAPAMSGLDVDSVLAADLSDCAEAPSGDPIRVGMAMDFSDVVGFVDIPGSKVVPYVAELINCAGGINGSPVEVRVAEVGDDAALATQELLDWGAHFLIGPPFADFALPILQTTGGQVPLFVAASTEPTLADASINSYLVTFDDYGMSEAAARWALDQGITRAIVFTEGEGIPYTGVNPDAFIAEFEANGGEVVSTQTYVWAADTDFSAQVNEIAGLSQNNEVVFSAALAFQVTALRGQLEGQGLDGLTYVGTDALDATGIQVEANNEGIAHTPHVSISAGDRVDTLLAGYEAAKGEALESRGFMPLYVDSMFVGIQGILDCGCADPAGIGEAVKQISGFEGLSGEITYAGTNGIPPKAVPINRIVDGEDVLVATIGADWEGGAVAAAPSGADEVACGLDEVDGDLNFYNWSEYMDPDLITAFQDQYGVTVTEDFYPSNEEMFGRVEAGGSGYDMIIPSDYMVSILISESMILPVPAAAVPNKPNIADTFADPPYDPGAVYTAAYQWGTTGVGVDIGITGEVPHTWGLLFDADLAEQYDLSGKITILDDPRETMGAALKYLGYSLNSTSESELAEAEAVIADAVSRVAAFDSDQYDELIVTGESVVGHGYSGNFLWGFEEGDSEYTYFVPDEGGTIWVDNMAVLADAPHPCTAFTFMNFLLDAENGAQLTNYNWYASPNAASKQYIDTEVLENPIIYPTDMSLLEFIEDTGDFEIEYTDALSRARS